jgi:hypothetical protein
MESEKKTKACLPVGGASQQELIEVMEATIAEN